MAGASRLSRWNHHATLDASVDAIFFVASAAFVEGKLSIAGLSAYFIRCCWNIHAKLWNLKQRRALQSLEHATAWWMISMKFRWMPHIIQGPANFSDFRLWLRIAWPSGAEEKLAQLPRRFRQVRSEFCLGLGDDGLRPLLDCHCLRSF